MEPIRAGIVSLLQHFGSEVYRDRRRFIGLLKDFLPGQNQHWQLRLLILTIQTGLLDKLIQQAEALPPALLLESHARALSEGWQIQPVAARWTIETWMICFELQLPPARRHRPPAVQAPIAPLPAVPPPDRQQQHFLNGLDMAFVRLEAGSFRMGSPPDEAGRDMNEQAHEVRLTRTFFLQTTPVTQAQWQRVLGENPSAFVDPERPVDSVDYQACQRFIERLNRLEPFRYRLPTEAEWEYAARAGSGSAYCFGPDEDRLAAHAWYAANSDGATRPVASREVNPWGLYDLYGNVREWVSDWFGMYSPAPQTDPSGPASGSYRISRGGSWRLEARFCRSACRRLTRPAETSADLGLRLALDL